MVGLFYLQCTNWQTAIFGIGPERMKNRMIAKAALEMFDQFDVIRDIMDHCREGDIEVTTSIFMHYGKTGLSAGCYRVAITNGPEELEEV
jgi:hypothetical protein